MAELARMVKASVSERRFRHIVGVVETAKRLAKLHGTDPERVETAAWLHDILREKTAAELADLCVRANVPIPAGEAATWHGPVTAALLPDYGVDDPEIAQAVACHTVGCKEMGLLALVLYVADSIEPSRDFPGIDALRQLAEKNLAAAALRIADASILHVLDTGEAISVATVEMRNGLLAGMDAVSGKA